MPIEPLKQEIIPPQERGWATGAMTWCSNLATLIFYFVMLGRFDDVSYLDGFPIRGESLIYWSASLFLAIFLLLIVLGIRETEQQSTLRGQRLTVRNFLGGLMDRELWPVYLLVFGNACLNFYAGLGALSNLLYTVQWNYTKQEMGVNVAVGGVLNLFIIGLLTTFADKLNRMRAYQTALVLSLVANIAYYGYVEFILPDKRPTLVEIIVFGESISILSILVGLLYLPLVYDYVRRNLMGTFNAGSTIVNRIATLVTLNGVGLFVTFYAQIFQPPAGEMTRVVLREPVTRSAMISSLRAANWPSASPVSALAADNWAATGVIEKQGRTWEIRRRDPDSEKLAKEKANLEAERSPLLSRQALAGDPAPYKAKIAAISTRIDAITAELNGRAGAFGKEVEHVLGPRLMVEGDQILGASQGQALVAQFATTSRPDPARIEHLLAKLRAEDSAIIDLRPLKRDDTFGLALSSTLAPGEDPGTLVAKMKSELSAGAPGLMVAGDPVLARQTKPSITLDLLLVEQPVDPYISPVTRTVNLVLGLVGHEPDPLHRLASTARSLRTAAAAAHVRVTPGPAPRSCTVTAVVEPDAPVEPAGDVLGRKLAALLEPAGHDLPQARALYDAVEIAAALQHLTIAHPVLASGYAALRYDYMSGYLWMFVMGSIGILLTFYFERLEARGVISKRGVKEAQAE
jgi:hypothetical protein